MASRKPSAQAKRIAAFKADAADFGDLFAREEQRRDDLAASRDAAREERACRSKNRYATRTEAQDAIAACAEHGRRGLHLYRCPYCHGWHLTSHLAR